MTLLSPKPTTNASGLGGPSPHEPTFLNAMLVVHTPTPPTITQSQPPTPIAMTDSLFGLSKLCEAKITFGTQDDEEARDMFIQETLPYANAHSLWCLASASARAMAVRTRPHCRHVEAVTGSDCCVFGHFLQQQESQCLDF